MNSCLYVRTFQVMFDMCILILYLSRITVKYIKKLCKEHGLYQTPELNDVLYLHYKGKVIMYP